MSIGSDGALQVKKPCLKSVYNGLFLSFYLGGLDVVSVRDGNVPGV